MNKSPDNIADLWAVSELEQRVDEGANAETMRELAGHYDRLGWPDEARRMRERADACPPEPEPRASPAAGEVPAAAEREARMETSALPPSTADVVLRGHFTPPVLLEIMRVLHETGKSGHLVMEAVGGTVATLALLRGRFIEAHATGGETGEAALYLALRIKGGRYQFGVGYPGEAEANLPPDTDGLLKTFAAEIAAR
jgi:hypothetical protein